MLPSRPKLYPGLFDVACLPFGSSALTNQSRFCSIAPDVSVACRPQSTGAILLHRVSRPFAIDHPLGTRLVGHIGQFIVERRDQKELLAYFRMPYLARPSANGLRL